MIQANLGGKASRDVSDSVTAIRADTFVVLLLAVGAVVWLWLLAKVVQPDDLWPGWGLPLSLEVLLVVGYRLRSRWPGLAAAGFVGGLLAAPMILLLEDGGRSAAPFLFILPVLIAGSLRGQRGALVAASVASVAIALGSSRASAPLDLGTLAGAMALIWLTALASWATTRNLLTALHWAEANSAEAARNLNEARDYQARLSAALRQLEEANYRLERANYALTAARAEADEARRFKAQFAAQVSHELRTPINLVVGFSDLMLHHPETYGDVPLPPPYLTDLATLHRSARHLRQLIDDILDLAQVDAGEMPVLKEPTDLAALIHEVISTAGQLLERKGLTIAVELAEGLPVIRLDRLRIRQVLLNLLNNAVRFTERGGVRVRAYLDRDQAGERVVVEVIDSGIGIAPGDLGRLFKPFQQLESSPTRGRGGTGLGLAISKRFVELHGGEIWVRSAGVAGRGSVFAFALPLESGSLASAEGDDPRRHRWELVAAPPDPTIVVHDDDPAIVGLFQRHLGGYQVVGAATPAEAVELVARRTAEAIITDAPTTEEQAAWHRLWLEVATRTQAPVLGCPMPSGRRLARALGLVDYLVKPVTREELLASVRTVATEARTILVVDDEPKLVRLFCRMLRAASRDYRLLRAYDGEQALTVARETRPDLVLLDLLMPQIDGMTVLEKLRQDPALAAIPVVAVSARGVFEAIVPSSNRTFILVGDRPLPVSRLVGLTRSILDSLPPSSGEWSGGEDSSNAPGLPAIGAGSAASG